MAISILPPIPPSLVPDIPNLAGITEAGSVYAAAASKLGALIRPDRPPYGIAGYIFDVVESYTVEMKSNITDKKLTTSDLFNDRSKSIEKFEVKKEYSKPWYELTPETITVKGLVAEVSSTVPWLSEYAEPYMRALETVMPYVPDLASNAQKSYAEAERVARVADKVINQHKSLHALFKDKWGENKKPKSEMEDIPQTKQREVFEFFRYLWASKQLVTVETAWGVYKQMAIESITATQDSATTGRYLSSFTIKFKQLVTINEKDAKELKDKLSADFTKKYWEKGTAADRRISLEEAFKDFPATEKPSTTPK
jgi:hypothetical protein